LVVLDQLEKPGNLGAILRTADAAGVDAVLVADGAGDLYHPNVIRASCGALFALPVGIGSATNVRPWLEANRIRCIATRVDSSMDLWQQDWTGGVALVIGNEAEGLSTAWRESHISPVRIPMAGLVDSLNASVAAAVCLFEAVRQRRG
jgi:TrmH family RNA methyltransferase